MIQHREWYDDYYLQINHPVTGLSNKVQLIISTPTTTPIQVPTTSQPTSASTASDPIPASAIPIQTSPDLSPSLDYNYNQSMNTASVFNVLSPFISFFEMLAGY